MEIIRRPSDGGKWIQGKNSYELQNLKVYPFRPKAIFGMAQG
jgi:hypothetical protein